MTSARGWDYFPLNDYYEENYIQERKKVRDLVKEKCPFQSWDKNICSIETVYKIIDKNGILKNEFAILITGSLNGKTYPEIEAILQPYTVIYLEDSFQQY